MSNITLITALYNSRKYIAETAQSVFCQRGISIDWVVIDDCPDNGSIDFVFSLAKEASPANIRLIPITHQRNQGIRNTYRHGLCYASDAVKFLDHDDVLPDDSVLKRQYELLRKNSNTGLVFGDTELIDEESINIKMRRYPNCEERARIVNKKTLALNVLLNWKVPFYHGTFLSSVAALRDLYRAGDYNFDTELLVDMICSDYKIIHDPQVALKYRVHSENNSRRNAETEALFYEGRKYIASRLIGDNPIHGGLQVAYWKGLNRAHEIKSRMFGERY